MAEIFLARQKTELGGYRRCVVKKILPELANHGTFAEMLAHEAKLAARLSHTNVVQVFDLGRAGDRLFIAMEYVEGFDLNDLLRQCARAKVPLPWEMSIHVIREALKGLDYAHRRTDDEGKPLGIVHRDVSPSNLLVSFEGEVKVCDFGIARANEVLPEHGAGAKDHDIDAALKGKAGYMSPEHARAETVDARSDVFAAGIVLWELAAGRRMYKGGEGRAPLLEQARTGVVPELPSTSLPAEDVLRAILAKALSVDRNARYPSAAAMLRALDEYAAEAALVPSPLKLGEWLVITFGAEIVAERRARERAAAALERGAPVVLEAVATYKEKPVAELQVPEAAPSVPGPASERLSVGAAAPERLSVGAAERLSVGAPAPTGVYPATAGVDPATARVDPAAVGPKAAGKRVPAVALVAAVAVVAAAAAAVVLAAR
jgi:serine/threonine-protein kinase